MLPGNAAPPQATRPATGAVVFGVLCIIGALGLIVSWLTLWAIVGLPSLLLIVVGIIGAIAAAGSGRGMVAIFCGVQGIGLVLTFAGAYLVGRPGLIFGMVALFVGAVGTTVAAARSRKAAAPGQLPGAPPQPLGYTAEGQPFYPIIGYTSDGRPVTADQAPGFQMARAGTNGMAVTALIMAFVATPLAIPFGHVARSQIRRTGEQGAGMALAGMVLGYLWVGLILLVVLYMFVGYRLR